ncbi:hypothetical protein [Streptomyces exfoliatus]|uniref:hypothetical protein n=1 Tax=Streptomyces exfoliatus TaxID=1905 RepID=UPI0004CA3368|nr:hypothetical protein [Streptomyces exfoliatus]
MSTLALLVVLLVVLLLVITDILFLGAIGYLTDRHPRLAKPLAACGTWADALIATVALVVALR